MNNTPQQRTIAKTVSCKGIGVHSGREVHLTIHPAPSNQGIQFMRSDLMDSPRVTAHFNNVVDTSQATVIGYNGFIVSTIEHLMAAFAGLGIDNATVELDSHEMPIMDGSAGPFTALLRSAGVRTQEGARCYFVVNEPIELSENGKFVGIYPDTDFRITCTIEYDHPLIGLQTLSVDVNDRVFEAEISRARTFGFLHEYEYMKHYGLAQGGSLENVVVIDEDSVLNPEGLRFPDEFVRHKILDCLGDFSLLGMPLMGHVKAVKSGHAFNHEFLKAFFLHKDKWETVTVACPVPSESPPANRLAI
jgi:UDP-3-O-[3-hydroxymyristoyl] N-acetylglucosamine deacetylase